MQLPAVLRAAINRELDGVSLTGLARDASAISARYRAEILDGRLHLASEKAVLAYCATRMPATYAAIRSSLAHIEMARPDFTPESFLDIGAGPGTALWAATESWSSIAHATLIEKSAAAVAIGERFLGEAGIAPVRWISADVTRFPEGLAAADLVTVAYVLDEIEAAPRMRIVEDAWSLTSDILVIVEPGTPAGWRRILEARGLLVKSGAHLLAPCPHEKPCPLAEPDWCHFSRRVARSRAHRLAKQGEVPWEDEKFIYLVASRRSGAPVEARVIAPPRDAKGQVALKLCRSDGSAMVENFSRRDGDSFKMARRAEWGDALATLQTASR